ncbi:hypothetical protein HL667_33600 [Bradyrhizobium sp. 83012]|uniref:Uncharacterized protein n=1 Tax=Bradyrhizobium aeschynomenes TaxID=2734909 RepID=A0ABX2CRK2_9BRAD|nr:hypothetical protein [Bradyrhizobium aeschynomenes]NPU69967.1 hypothetical protein [Bradyrhizobium aeschynomenes]
MMAARICLAVAVGSTVLLAGALLLPDVERTPPSCARGSIAALTTGCAVRP